MGDRREFVVYLSSTLADLEPERDAALKAIAEFGTVKTSYRAAEEGVVATCTQDVRGCDLYIGILGQRYGWVPGGEDNPEAKSITELEYDTCCDQGKPPISRLMFIKTTKAGIDDAHIDALTHPKTAHRMAAFLKRASEDQVPFLFNTLADLRAEVRIRVKEKADAYHREYAVGFPPILGGGRPRKNQLTPLTVACIKGTDHDIYQRIVDLGDARFKVFEVSPEDPQFLAALDQGCQGAQASVFLITPASLSRLAAIEVRPKIAAAIDWESARGRDPSFLCVGVAKESLPDGWRGVRSIEIPGNAFTVGECLALDGLYADLRGLLPQVSAEPRLALPYLVLAPTLDEVKELCDPKGDAFLSFEDEDVRDKRQREFRAIAAAATKSLATWPAATYAARRQGWRCCGVGATAQEIVDGIAERLNEAAPGSREQRILQTAKLVPRRYDLDDFLDDRHGSAKAIERMRDQGGLILVDELALLHSRLRRAAEQLLSGTTSAIATISPCDPAHTATAKLLGDFSFLRIGNLVHRFRFDQDPRCEVALSGEERLKRWLRLVIPELVSAGDSLESNPALVANAHRLLD